MSSTPSSTPPGVGVLGRATAAIAGASARHPKTVVVLWLLCVRVSQEQTDGVILASRQQYQPERQHEQRSSPENGRVVNRCSDAEKWHLHTSRGGPVLERLTEPGFELPNAQNELDVRSGLRWGGIEPVVLPRLAGELSVWYEGRFRTEPGSYGYASATFGSSASGTGDAQMGSDGLKFLNGNLTTVGITYGLVTTDQTGNDLLTLYTADKPVLACTPR